MNVIFRVKELVTELELATVEAMRLRLGNYYEEDVEDLLVEIEVKRTELKDELNGLLDTLSTVAKGV